MILRTGSLNQNLIITCQINKIPVNKAPTRILLNDFKRQWNLLGSDYIKAFTEIGSSGWYILGNEVKVFEGALSDKWGLSSAVGCANGLDAIEIALRALGLKNGEAVLTTPLSAFATTLAIIRAGGIPYFVDVDDTGNIDLSKADDFFSKSNVKYFVPVHLYGNCLDMQRLRSLKNKYDLKVVEDCAQSILARDSHAICGGVGQIATTSFYPTKNLGCMGDGGALLTNDNSLAETCKKLRDYGQSSKYNHTFLGLNSRLDEVQAAILNKVLLPRLTDFTNKRIGIAKTYIAQIKNSNIKIVTPQDLASSVWHLFPVLVKDRTSLKAHLDKHGVDSAVHYPIAIHHQKSLSEYKHIDTVLEKAQYFADHELSLPIHPFMDQEEIDRVIEACNTWV